MNYKVLRLLLSYYYHCIINYVYGSRVFPSAPFAPVYFLEKEGETDIGTYKPIGFLSPLQYKIFFSVN